MVLKLALVALIATATQTASGCDYSQTSNDVQAQRQEQQLTNMVNSVGIPAITHYTEKRLLKQVYELRDQAHLRTYTYLQAAYSGKLAFFCNSEGYGIPYSTQFTAGESMQRYHVINSDGTI